MFSVRLQSSEPYRVRVYTWISLIRASCFASLQCSITFPPTIPNPSHVEWKRSRSGCSSSSCDTERTRFRSVTKQTSHKKISAARAAFLAALSSANMETCISDADAGGFSRPTRLQCAWNASPNTANKIKRLSYLRTE